MSGVRLGGMTRDRDSIRPTSDVQGLPEPTTNQAQLQTDFVRWGYCIVKDALTTQQAQAQVALARPSGGRTRRRCHQDESSRHRANGLQSGAYLVPKGRPFRDLIALEENAIVQAPMIERLMKE